MRTANVSRCRAAQVSEADESGKSIFKFATADGTAAEDRTELLTTHPKTVCKTTQDLFTLLAYDH